MEFPGVLLYCDFIRLFWSLSVGVPSVCSEFETICQADATEMEVPSLFGKLCVGLIFQNVSVEVEVLSVALQKSDWVLQCFKCWESLQV